MMDPKGGILFSILVSSLFMLSLSASSEVVDVVVGGATSIAKTDENFICATMDWWPPDKCDYGQCPWGNSGVFNLDWNNKILRNAVKEFKPLRIRLGGSLEDQVVYNVGEKKTKNCTPFKKDIKHSVLFNFTKGCLDMKKWDEINGFFNRTGATVTFSLNALIGRTKSKTVKDLWVGKWDSQNARDLMSYTISKGYKIDSYELGNELCGTGVSAKVEAEQYGLDMRELSKVVKELYHDPNTRPKIIGPAGFYEEKWFNTFLQVTGPNVLDAVTHHIYNIGPGNDPKLIETVQNPYKLTEIAQTFKDVSNAVNKFTPWAGPWVGEGGGAYNSGGKYVSHTFADGFWYLDQLGMTSTFNHKVYCRQVLIGGNYGLLNTTSFIPNPDYYGALLWHKLMGSAVLSATHSGSPYLRVYSHCAKTMPGISIILINLSNNTSFEVSLSNDLSLYNSVKPNVEFKGHSPREEYHLTPNGKNIQSDVVLLNGTPLTLTKSLEIPKLKPKLVDPSTPIAVEAHSIVYVTIRDFIAPACAA